MKVYSVRLGGMLVKFQSTPIERKRTSLCDFRRDHFLSLRHVSSEIYLIILTNFNAASAPDHFAIKQTAKKLDGQFECLEGNSEKYITFLVLIEEQEKEKTIRRKQENNDKMREQIRKKNEKMRVIHNVRVMVGSLPSLADYIEEENHKTKCKNCNSSL